MQLDLRCRLHHAVRYGFSQSILQKLSIFSPPGPTYRCPFTEPLEGFSVPASPAICFKRFTVDGHVADRHCIQLHLVRPPLFIIGVATRSGFLWNFVKSTFSLTGNVTLGSCDRQLYTPNCWHTEQEGKFTEMQPFARDTDVGAFRAQGIRLLQNVRLHASTTSSSSVSPWSDNTSKDPRNQQSQRHVSGCFLLFFIATSNTFSSGCRYWRSSLKVSLGSAIKSDVTNAPTAKTFFVCSAFSSTFGVAFGRVVRGFGENFLPVSEFQTVQVSIFAQRVRHYWHHYCWPRRSNFLSSLEQDHECDC